ncbi:MULTISPECIES: YicC/YloC family endoribonuclease [Legionella]|uniref:YicC family protein n=1 Tax=Legionella septentrionalis TaxID=2498109 RepID=A0A3S0V6H1_9GAMM|nr:MULTISPECIES: YicC/YloC family endoribonuclease [Legionella]MCP0914116.1 YicC family protein [Legionella sp. 27cVA30]RUQ90808.1 YicC family protein [Legionella septentrionalis]RUQ99967.1 YicC family protein [Legionella septentrionalis]RUR10188.1 YicC family protein [Legionella septentrionalis]RUR15800.1 YicC family protein [Legionella septentrionalis]
MPQSMTAFARMQNQMGPNLLCWELRSLNHRYLDVSFRLPEPFRHLEMNLRNQLREFIHRGKLECQLKISDALTYTPSLLINEELVQALLNTAVRLTSEQQLANDLSVSQVLAWPGVVRVNQPDTDALNEEIMQLFSQALQRLVQVRKAEGQALKDCIQTRLHLLHEEVSLAAKKAASLVLQTREKLISRLHNLEMSVDESRLEQEIALLLTRLDVSEELDRLQTHMQEVGRTLDNQKEAIGRRLDFLMQELNREANTLSSKSDSAELTQCAVQMKVLIEQMREQIQNIE